MRKFSAAKGFAPIQEGPQHAVVSDEIELGLQPNFDGTGKTWQHSLRLEFPFDKTEEGTPKTLWVTVNESLFAKSKLGKIFAAAGRLPAKGEEVSIATLHGANLTVVIEHVEKDDKTYANASSFSKLPAGTKPVEPIVPRGNVPEWLKLKQAAGGFAGDVSSTNGKVYATEEEKLKAEITAGCEPKW